MKRFLLVAAACFLLAAPCFAQNTLVTATFKTPEGKTPAQANLKSSATVGATPIYGKAYFRATDVAGNLVRELTRNNETHVGEALGFIKSDGTLISYAETAGVRLIPTVGALPAGLAYCLELQWNGSTDGRVGPQVIKGKNLCKNIPDQASADWAGLPVASLTTPSFGYQTGLAGAMLNYENWTCVTSASVPTPAAGLDNFFCDSADSNKLKRKISDGSVVNVEAGGGSSTTISIDAVNLTTQSPLNFQDTAEIDWTNPSAGNVQIALKAASVADSKLATISTTDKVSPGAINDGGVAATQALFSGAAGAAGFRAIADADVPDTITLTNITQITNRAITDLSGQIAIGQTPLTTRGDLLSVNSLGNLYRLPEGTNGQTLQTNGLDNIWVTRNVNTTAPLAGGGSIGADLTLTCNVASGAQPGCLASADWTTFNNSVDSVSGTAEEISSTGGATPVLSIPAVLNLAGKTLKGGSPLVFEGLTVDANDTTLVVIDPTAPRSFTLPNADSVAVQPLTCDGTDKVSAVSALGVITCTADSGAAGGDSISVNAVAAIDADLDDATPAAPANATNVKWQKDALTPNNISAHILWSTLGTATFGANADFNWTFDTAGAGTPSFGFAGTIFRLTGFSELQSPGIRALANDSTLALSGTKVDGATAVGVISNNTIALTVAGSKIHSFQNASVEKSYVDKDGGFSGNAATATTATTATTANAGDSATAFFSTGALELAIGGTNQTAWTAARCVQVNAGGTALESAVGACGTSSGDSISVNGVAAIDADLDDATPAAPANAVNVKFQKDALTPNNISAHLLLTDVDGAGLAVSGTELVTASSETGFLASGALVCGAATAGKMQVHTTALQYCDNAATPALQYAAYGLSTGEATTGDSATAFFPSGTLENTRLDADLAALGDNATSGLWARTGAGTGAARTLTAGQGVQISDGAGTAANPTVRAVVPIFYAMLARGGFTWTNMPAAATEFAGTTTNRAQTDLTYANEVRFHARMPSPVCFAGATLKAQYSTDETTWNDLTTTVACDSTGTKVSTWQAVPGGAIGAIIYLRIVGTGGDGVIDPVFDMLGVQFR